MLPRDSKSYPYLAIAQHLGVDYGGVLHMAEWMESDLIATEYWAGLHNSKDIVLVGDRAHAMHHFVALAVKAERRRRLLAGENK